MKEYSNGEMTVYWNPEKCIHSRNCVKGLPAVFDRGKRPWINMKGASSEDIMRTIDRCPSGALSYKRNDGAKNEHPADENAADEPVHGVDVRVTSKGPLIVDGRFRLIDEDGLASEVKGPVALCRCGGSKNKPYCDGTHKAIGFGEE